MVAAERTLLGPGRYTLLDRSLTILVVDGAAPSNVESLAVGMQGTASDALDMDQQNVGLTMAK
ncbi:hypothetical protein Pmar_PMAR002778 [Perkinsus marinus ATCC 50983]|uniref:Uncharacterized protein n=1 Tax=Perkinsus marinus (strain ATCC 50983 / TXsc) TaxID=423536 RepID=C5KR57_PERM5|nr:hypothetical protein Pmar_PMAR002778 [Perkinsus marinus ATCC 50983]EER13035.1 hypothetical protein Pmar_PMAR002778 [Perkinsus marinus ATCC 50983]|eukprot:XP_002781240.1 hypothetical protein Pmar_PMAR002778 [Perkinsus marinus ATCC 50983]